MILYVNGIRNDATASLDLLTRAVVISLFTWRRAERDDRTPQPYGWWGTPGLLFRMTASVPASTC